MLYQCVDALLASVSSATWHPSGAVLATCSGERPSSADPKGDRDTDTDSDNDSDSDSVSAGSGASQTMSSASDNTLKIWTL